MKSAFHRIAPMLAITALTLVGNGCVAHAYVSTTPVLVTVAPPPPVYYEVASCSAGSVYVEGYHHWNGSTWIWVEPSCAYKPGYLWVGPSYVTVSGGVHYKAGYWITAPKKKKIVHTGKPVVTGQPKANPKTKAKPVHSGKPVK